MLWIDTLNNSIVNLSTVFVIEICDEDGKYFQSDEVINPDMPCSVFCQTPAPGYKDDDGDIVVRSYIVFTGKYSECLRFMEWIKTVLGDRFINIPNNILELEKYTDNDQSYNPDEDDDWDGEEEMNEYYDEKYGLPS